MAGGFRYQYPFLKAKVLSSATSSSYLSLLMHMEDESGSTTFIDSSPNNFSLTRYGNTVISTAQKKFGSSSAYFDGSGDYLTIAPDSSFNLTGDFTIEAWIYTNSQALNYSSIVSNGYSSFQTGCVFLMNYGFNIHPRKIGFGTATTNPIVLSTTIINTNTWYHVAVSRNGSTVKLFINGIEEASATNTETYDFSYNNLQIGRNSWDGAQGYWNGYIDELRIIKGAALYTSSFTPPTAAFDNTNPISVVDPPEIDLAYFGDYYQQNGLHFYNTGSLLLGTAKNITFPITKINSNYSLSSLNNKLLVDASNNNIIISVPQASTLPRQEFLIKRIDTSSYTVNIQNENEIGYFENVFLTGSLAINSGDNFGSSIVTNELGNKLIIGAPNDELNATQGTGVVYVYNSSSIGWQQEAILTGSLSTNAADSFGNSVIINKNADKIFVGAYKSEIPLASIDSGLAYSFVSSSSGWKEEKIFTGSFQKDFSDYFGISLACNENGDKLVIGASSEDSPVTTYGLGLLLHMENVSGTTVFVDSSPNKFSIATNSDAVISTAQKKFGSSSGYFDGNGDGLTVVNGNYLQFKTLDFTIETWVYNIGNGQVNIFETRNGSEGAYPVLGITNNGNFYWYLNNNYEIISDVTGALNTWNHIAVSRKSGVTRMFLNGTQTGISYIDNNNYVFPRLLIGTYNFGVAGSFYGYLDEYRIIVGTGLYTASFTAPSDQFSDSDDYGTYNTYVYSNSGAAFIFNSSSNGWVEEFIINSSNSLGNISYDSLGKSVAINKSGSIVFVGSPNFKIGGAGGAGAGAIYTFISNSSGWTDTHRILPPQDFEHIYGAFGTSISCNDSGNVVFVGSPFGPVIYSDRHGGRGAIYKYINNNWTLEKELTGSRAITRNDQFGVNLLLNNRGDVAFSCAPNDERSAGLQQEGLVYLFISGNNGWQEKQIIINNLSNQADSYNVNGINENFGYSICANKDLTKIFIGSPNNQINTAVSDTGLVYEFKISGSISEIYSSSIDVLSDLYGSPTRLIYNSSSLPLTNDGNTWYFI